MGYVTRLDKKGRTCFIPTEQAIKQKTRKLTPDEIKKIVKQWEKHADKMTSKWAQRVDDEREGNVDAKTFRRHELLLCEWSVQADMCMQFICLLELEAIDEDKEER